MTGTSGDEMDAAGYRSRYTKQKKAHDAAVPSFARKRIASLTTATVARRITLLRISLEAVMAAAQKPEPSMAMTTYALLVTKSTIFSRSQAMKVAIHKRILTSLFESASFLNRSATHARTYRANWKHATTSEPSEMEPR